MLNIAWNPSYHHPLPEGHRFPMDKYSLIPQQLLYEGVITQRDIFSPKAATEQDVLRTHDAYYFKQLKSLALDKKAARRIGFPLSQALVERELLINGGTIQCSTFALKYGLSFNVAGGTHHAYANRGEGFCLLNDQAMAANYLLDKKKAKHILIIDLDVHQGNGTASIFSGNSAVFTFSMHGEKNYPFKKEVSDLDVGLPKYTDDDTYLNTLSDKLSWIFKHFAPDFVFYQAGVDVLKSDKLGLLSISKAGCMQRDALVFDICFKASLPIVVCMGGGYSPDIKDILDAHVNTFKLGIDRYFS